MVASHEEVGILVEGVRILVVAFHKVVDYDEVVFHEEAGIQVVVEDGDVEGGGVVVVVVGRVVAVLVGKWVVCELEEGRRRSVA